MKSSPFLKTAGEQMTTNSPDTKKIKIMALEPILHSNDFVAPFGLFGPFYHCPSHKNHLPTHFCHAIDKKVV